MLWGLTGSGGNDIRQVWQLLYADHAVVDGWLQQRGDAIWYKDANLRNNSHYLLMRNANMLLAQLQYVLWQYSLQHVSLQGKHQKRTRTHHDGDNVGDLTSQLKDNDRDGDGVSDGSTEGGSAHHCIGSCWGWRIELVTRMVPPWDTTSSMH